MKAKEGEDCKTHQEYHKDLLDCGKGLTCRLDERDPYRDNGNGVPFPGKCIKEGKEVRL
jgi:hypothetical protein